MTGVVVVALRVAWLLGVVAAVWAAAGGAVGVATGVWWPVPAGVLLALVGSVGAVMCSLYQVEHSPLPDALPAQASHCVMCCRCPACGRERGMVAGIRA